MCTRCVRFTREITQTGELEVMRRGNHAEIDIFPGHAGRQPAGRQRRRPLPGRRPARQGLPPQAARLVPLQARRDLHRAARPAATSAPRRTGASSGGSSRGPTRTSTTTGSATRAGTATRRPTTRTCSPPCTSARTATSSRRRSTEAMAAVDGGLQAGRRSGAASIAGVLSPFLTVEEAYLMASLPQGAEPRERAGARARCRSGART